MKSGFNPKDNFHKTLKECGYVPLQEATQETYDNIGFMSGLEVHQQLLTKEKLFCHCPSGIYNDDDDYDAEIIRHMRPTLSEMGEYDGTALMEFKTRKTIIYRINNENACTYEIDDTPPFPMNKEALEIALEISLLCKFNIVGEVHITRKQYLDGSIPTGFQRTAILGTDGEIQLKNKKIRLIQLSIEEDSAREISDVGHVRIYKTDRLGMPLIETVTYPDMKNPWEVKEACDFIRFINRSTGKVRTGIGASRQDVNVSCKGGTRIEIKGVSHTKWIPALTHNEVFRQWALLKIKDKLTSRISKENWKPVVKEVKVEKYSLKNKFITQAIKKDYKFYVVNLPYFKGLLSHFTQPDTPFASEFEGRLKVIACLEKPNMFYSEQFDNSALPRSFWNDMVKLTGANEDSDAQILVFGPAEDMETALETIEERALMTFDGVPKETRKAFENGTTTFERVLPGADRMYPDTDSAPIPLEDEYIEKLEKNIPEELIRRYEQLQKWNVPENYYTYIFSKNLYPVIKKIVDELGNDPKFIGSFFGQRMKYVEGHFKPHAPFDYNRVYDMFKFIKENGLVGNIAYAMLPHVYTYPRLDFESILNLMKFRKRTEEEITAPIKFLKEKYKEIAKNLTEEATVKWVMGELHNQAIGNMDLKKLYQIVKSV